MTKTDVLKVLSILKLNYPGFYRNLNEADVNDLVNLWCDILQDERAEDVMAAVKAVIATDDSKYPPNIGTIRKMLSRIEKPMQDTSQDGWNEVRRAVRGAVYMDTAARNFERLSEISKRIVGSPSQLMDYANMSPEEFNTIAQSNFLKSYRAMEKSRTDYESLPTDVKRIVDSKQDLLTEGALKMLASMGVE